ncbi:MAG: ABC transporter permease, partial [Pseudomonadales bacterium]
MMTFVLNTAVGESREPVEFAIVGADYAPDLVAHLERQNTIIHTIESADPKQEVIDDLRELILVIPANYRDRFTRGEINSVSLIYDSSEIGSNRRHFGTVRDMIRSYARMIGILRLQLRGIEPTITAPVIVQAVDTASPAARALSILATLPYLLVLVIFMGGFYLAIDATAGEREHGSLEPLLSQPVSRTQLVLGKLFAASIFSGASLMAFLVSLILFIPIVPFHKVGMSLEIGPLAAIGIFFIAVPLMVFGAALLTVVASFAKSYKEAQTYLTVVILVPTLPLIVAQLMNVESSALLMLVPSLSQASLIGEMMTGAPISALHVV